MSKRITLVALSACAVIGVAMSRNAASGPQRTDLTAPELPQLLGYTMAELAVPQDAGAPFDVAVPLAGEQRVVSLVPYSIRTEDFQLLVDEGDGRLVPVEASPPSTYRGEVVGVPNSWAAGAVIDGRLQATVVIDGAAWSIEPLDGLAPQGAQVAPDAYAIYRDEDAIPPDKGCGGAIPNPNVQDAGGGAAAGGGIAGGTGLEIVEIGCDTDVEYWQKNGSNVDATMIDIENIINNVSVKYEVQIGVTFEVSTIVVRTGSTGSDPYSSSICSTLLNQFRNTWSTSPENFIRRDVAHLFTGRNLADCLGIAWLAALCEGASGFGYGVVESRAPGLPFTHRVATSAHEIGHNFNAPHCCGGCSGCSSCRIMCPCIGGCSGNVSSFGNSSVNFMTSYASSLFCLQPEPLPLSPPFFDTFPSTSLDADNWRYNNGALVNSGASNEPSPSLSLNLDAVGAGEYQFNEIRTNMIDLSGVEGDGFFVQFFTQAVGVETGEKLLVDYWTGTAGTMQWRNLATIASDGTDETEFTEHLIFLDGLAPSPFQTDFRIRFISDVNNSGDEWYVDNVFIGGTPPPSNDACSAAIPVGEGSFPVTTIGATTDGLPEFCDGGGGGATFDDDTWFLYTPTCTDEVTFSVCNAADFDSRLAVYIAGECPPSGALACSDDAAECGVTSEVTVLVTPLLSYLVRVGATAGGGTGTLTISCPAQQPCPWDCADGDGNVGINDFLQLLAEWGSAGGCDFDGGGVGINDFLELLANWGPCP